MRRLFFTSLLLSANILMAAPQGMPPRNAAVDCPCFFKQKCSKWYVGSGISFADLLYFSNKQSNDFTADFFSFNDSEQTETVSAPSLGYNVFFGYSYNSYIDLELKGVQIVRSFQNSYKLDFIAANDNDNSSGTTKLYLVTFGPYVLINMPLFESFTPFFRFGMVTDLVTYKENSREIDQFDIDQSEDSGMQKQFLWLERFNVGMGFKSTWKDLVAVKVEYETPLSNSINGEAALAGNDFYIPGILSASILFRF